MTTRRRIALFAWLIGSCASLALTAWKLPALIEFADSTLGTQAMGALPGVGAAATGTPDTPASSPGRPLANGMTLFSPDGGTLSASEVARLERLAMSSAPLVPKKLDANEERDGEKLGSRVAGDALLRSGKTAASAGVKVAGSLDSEEVRRLMDSLLGSEGR